MYVPRVGFDNLVVKPNIRRGHVDIYPSAPLSLLSTFAVRIVCILAPDEPWSRSRLYRTECRYCLMLAAVLPSCLARCRVCAMWPRSALRHEPPMCVVSESTQVIPIRFGHGWFSSSCAKFRRLLLQRQFSTDLLLLLIPFRSTVRTTPILAWKPHRPRYTQYHPQCACDPPTKYSALRRYALARRHSWCSDLSQKPNTWSQTSAVRLRERKQ